MFFWGLFFSALFFLFLLFSRSVFDDAYATVVGVAVTDEPKSAQHKKQRLNTNESAFVILLDCTYLTAFLVKIFAHCDK